MRKILFPALHILFVTLIYVSVSAQSITITSAPDVVCFQSTIDVFYSTTGSFNAGNKFALEFRRVGIATVFDLLSQSDNGSKISGTFPTTSQTDYEIRVTSSSPAVASTWKPITIRPQATATISGASTVCQGGAAPNITFNNPIALPVTVVYNINGGSNQTININANASNTVSRSTATGGSFTYNLVSVAFQTVPACTSTATGSATVTVRSTPTATISGTTTVPQGASAPQITFTNSLSAPIVVTYNVNGGANQTININANSTNTVTQSTAAIGTFTYNLVSASYQTAPVCSATATGACTITVQSTPTSIINLNSTEQSSSVSLYPNPAKDQVIVSWNRNASVQNVQISIFDVTGKRLFEKYLPNTSLGRTDLDLRWLVRGVYFVKVMVDNKSSVTTKFIKE